MTFRLHSSELQKMHISILLVSSKVSQRKLPAVQPTKAQYYDSE